MWIRGVKRIVKNLFRGEPNERPSQRSALERELLDHHREIYGSRAVERGLSTRQAPRFRVAWAAAAALMLLIATGEAVPGSYSVSVGWLLTWDVSSPSEPHPAVSELVSGLEGSDAAEQISVSIDQQPDGGFRLHLILFGARTSTADVVLQMQRRYPDLTAGPVRTEELVGTFKTSLTRQIGRSLFPVEIDSRDVARARAQILAKLAASGRTASRVEFSERDGVRRIDIDIED